MSYNLQIELQGAVQSTRSANEFLLTQPTVNYRSLPRSRGRSAVSLAKISWGGGSIHLPTFPIYRNHGIHYRSYRIPIDYTIHYILNNRNYRTPILHFTVHYILYNMSRRAVFVNMSDAAYSTERKTSEISSGSGQSSYYI